ncbi:MAG: hypothetical protein PVF68_14710, partial [Acidobacteriota bacterium]
GTEPSGWGYSIVLYRRWLELPGPGQGRGAPTRTRRRHAAGDHLHGGSPATEVDVPAGRFTQPT